MTTTTKGRLFNAKNDAAKKNKPDLKVVVQNDPKSVAPKRGTKREPKVIGSTVAELNLLRSVKNSHVYGNDDFSGLYFSKVEFPDPKNPPAQIRMTLEFIG